MPIVPRETDAPPDWSRAKVDDPAPCIACGRPALLRHPETGRPHHKVCDERTAPVPTLRQQAAEILPCHICGEPASLQGPEGKPEHWTCRRTAGTRG